MKYDLLRTENVNLRMGPKGTWQSTIALCYEPSGAETEYSLPEGPRMQGTLDPEKIDI
jgi:hypothetical protein